MPLIEVAHVMGWLGSFCAALLVLWRAVDVALFITPSVPLDLLWVRLGFSAAVIASLLGASFFFLQKSREVQAENRLIGMIEQLDASDVAVDILREVTGRVRMGGLTNNLSEIDESSKRALVAGRWVLDRFKEGAVVISVPASLADTKKLRSALGAGDASVEILQPGSSSARYE